MTCRIMKQVSCTITVQCFRCFGVNLPAVVVETIIYFILILRQMIQLISKVSAAWFDHLFTPAGATGLEDTASRFSRFPGHGADAQRGKQQQQRR